MQSRMKDKRIQIEEERLTTGGKESTVKKMAIKTGNEIFKKRGKNIRKLQNTLKKTIEKIREI